MMQLLCNGVVLDLYEGTGLQFKHENPLFAFDNIKCERTTNFKLPATPTNDGVFALARIPAYEGEGMRKRFSAQLQAGTVVKNGYLYVFTFDGKDYNATFVTGELVGLQQIKDLGKLKDIMTYEETIAASYAVKSANDSTFKTAVFDAYRYEGNAGATIFPSVNVGLLLDKICAHIGVQCATPEQAYDMRLAPPSLAVPEKVEGAHIKSTRTGDAPYNAIFPDLIAHGIIEEHTLVARRTVTYRRATTSGDIVAQYDYDTNVQHFRTPQDIAITFPDDFSEHYFLCYMNPLVTGYCVFLGDYSFTRNTPTSEGEGGFQTTGEPLAGRTVGIPAGTSFILIQAGAPTPAQNTDFQSKTEFEYYYVDDEPVYCAKITRGWDFANGLDYDFEVDVEFNEENAMIYRLQDNLPDITFTELLKAVAAELGLVLRYSDADGITFDTLQIDNFEIKEISKITKHGEVQRIFADYAQRSVVRYKDDAAFAPQLATPEAYIIQNDNIEAEKDLQVLPWTNGGQFVGSGGVQVYDKAGRSEFLELRYNAGGIAALRAFIIKNNTIQRLCDASTQIKIDAHMPLLTYDGIKPDTALLVDNSPYFWTNRSWQKDTAQFTLAKFQKKVAPPTPQINAVKCDGIAYFELNLTPAFVNAINTIEIDIIFNGVYTTSQLFAAVILSRATPFNGSGIGLGSYGTTSSLLLNCIKYYWSGMATSGIAGVLNTEYHLWFGTMAGSSHGKGMIVYDENGDYVGESGSYLRFLGDNTGVIRIGWIDAFIKRIKIDDNYLFIPYKQNGEVGFYDEINGVFYGNQNSEGRFTEG